MGRPQSVETRRKIGEGNRLAHPIAWYNVICEGCGKELKVRRKSTRYCCSKCYHKHKMFVIKCSLCGEDFNATVPNARYCIKCRSKKCEICGKEMILNSYEVGNSSRNISRKYCSKKCFHISEKGRPACNKEEPTVITCLICKKQFAVWKSRLTRDVKYCSYKCKYEGQSLVTNINHPLWKGGHDLYSRLLSESEGSFWRNRKVVLERDIYTCQHCWHQGESNYMDVHHIIKVVDGGSSLPENMITLCRKCHNKADKGRIPIEMLLGKLEVVI